jgi:hypothetical protein
MSTRFIGESVWTEIKKSAKRHSACAYVAVPFFGQGAARLLPIRAGSALVVNAGERTVKSGLTCPDELKKLVQKKVQVFTQSNLHAKVYVFPKHVYVGSANASNRSARGGLVEAVVMTTDKRTVAAAREFVRDHCIQPLTMEWLDKLAKIYKPPKFIPGAGAGRKGSTKYAIPRVYVEEFTDDELPLGSKRVHESGRRVAKERAKNPKSLDSFWYTRDSPYRRGDVVVEVHSRGSRRLMCPPATIIHMRNWRRGTKTAMFHYLDSSGRRSKDYRAVSKKLGLKLIKHYGRWRVPQNLAAELLRFWNSPT